MKSKDWALVTIVVVVVGMISYFVVNALLPPPNSKSQTIPVVTSNIPSSVGSTPSSVFNQSAVNPAFPTSIGNTGTTSPFTTNKEN